MGAWSYQRLLEKSDLVVVASPVTVEDTQERLGLPGLESQRVIGVETKLQVAAVFKGDKEIKSIVLHHYRADGPSVPNGPNLVAFDPSKKRAFLIFLVREQDGRYAPASGQIDPAMFAVHALEGPLD